MKTTPVAYYAASLLTITTIQAQIVVPPYSANYSVSNLGGVAGVGGKYAALTFSASNPNTLLLAGNGNSPSGAIYSVSLTRGAGGHVTGFNGTPTVLSTAPDIDGGLAYGPSGVLFYTTFNNSENRIGEIKPGSSATDKFITIPGNGGSLTFTPNGIAGTGNLNFVDYTSGQFSTATLVADGSGTFDFGTLTSHFTLGGNQEGLAFIKGVYPNFPTDTLLGIDYHSGTAAVLSAYQLGEDGIPTLSTKTTVINGLHAPQSIAIDPLTGDLLMASLHEAKIYKVQGFNAIAVPEPSACAMVSGLALLGYTAWSRRQR